MLKRSAFSRPKPAKPPRPPLKLGLRAQGCRMWDGKDSARVEVKKPERAKPGKRTPTAAERDWMDRITTFGCIACYIDGNHGTPGAVHHILRAGRRIGHLFSICLCDPGHHQHGRERGMVSRHPHKVRFEQRYGSENHLLALTQTLVKPAAAAA